MLFGRSAQMGEIVFLVIFFLSPPVFIWNRKVVGLSQKNKRFSIHPQNKRPKFRRKWLECCLGFFFLVFSDVGAYKNIFKGQENQEAQVQGCLLVR